MDGKSENVFIYSTIRLSQYSYFEQAFTLLLAIIRRNELSRTLDKIGFICLMAPIPRIDGPISRGALSYFVSFK